MGGELEKRKKEKVKIHTKLKCFAHMVYIHNRKPLDVCLQGWTHVGTGGAIASIILKNIYKILVQKMYI